MGLPFSPLCDRTSTLVAQSQIGEWLKKPPQTVCHGGALLDRLFLSSLNVVEMLMYPPLRWFIFSCHRDSKANCPHCTRRITLQKKAEKPMGFVPNTLFLPQVSLTLLWNPLSKS